MRSAVVSGLRDRFRTLPKAQRARLRRHAKRRTPIACGDDARAFVTVSGAG